MCKQCMFYTPDSIGIGWCIILETYSTEHGFCDGFDPKDKPEDN